MVKAKAFVGSAVLSTAYATARFSVALIRALKGEKNVVETAYVRSDVTEAKYFATPLLLGKNGVKKNLGLPPLSRFEQQLLKVAIPALNKDIRKGEDYANK